MRASATGPFSPSSPSGRSRWSRVRRGLYGFDFTPSQLAVDPFERLDLAVAKGGFPAADQLLLARIRHFPEDFFSRPGGICAHRDTWHRPGVRSRIAPSSGAPRGPSACAVQPDARTSFHDVPGEVHVLALHHALDAPLLLQDVRNPVQQRRQVGRWVQSGVHGVDRAGRRKGAGLPGRRSPPGRNDGRWVEGHRSRRSGGRLGAVDFRRLQGDVEQARLARNTGQRRHSSRILSGQRETLEIEGVELGDRSSAG